MQKVLRGIEWFDGQPHLKAVAPLDKHQGIWRVKWRRTEYAKRQIPRNEKIPKSC